MGGGEGREGDWECGSCRNRNYGFRSLCNRCKQPRLLVDTKTPADSKWLPRIGDWICSGCSNNNYASREQCKKCGQPKEEAAMPLAMAMPGASSFPTYANYFARTQGLLGLRMNYGMMGSLQQSLSQYSSWPYAGANKYGLQSGSSWPVAGNSSGYSYGQDTNAGVPKGWRSGDWLCECGFHNYSSRTECKKCSAPAPTGATSSSVARTATSDLFPTLGTKRLASEEFINDWDNKRLNAGDLNTRFLGFEHLAGNDISGIYSKYPSGSSAATSNIGMHIQSPQQGITPAVGKGAKQWRDGDWMCSNCNNHNFASRSFCNRCKSQKEAGSQSVSVA